LASKFFHGDKALPVNRGPKPQGPPSHWEISHATPYDSYGPPGPPAYHATQWSSPLAYHPSPASAYYPPPPPSLHPYASPPIPSHHHFYSAMEMTSSPPPPECDVEDWCKRFGLGESELEGLKKLGFRVGDKLDESIVPSSVWKEAGFLPLQWNRVREADRKWRKQAKQVAVK
jgi:hypothetical protein